MSKLSRLQYKLVNPEIYSSPITEYQTEGLPYIVNLLPQPPQHGQWPCAVVSRYATFRLLPKIRPSRIQNPTSGTGSVVFQVLACI